MADHAKRFTATLDTQKQTIEHIQQLVAKVGGVGGCPRCGRIAVLDIQFGDPAPDYQQLGVTSVTVIGG